MDIIWAMLCEKVPNGLSCCHTKRRTGVCGRAHPSFGMTPSFYIFFRKRIFLTFFFWWKVGVMPKEGCMWPTAPVFLLAWHRLRTLETFSWNSAHIRFISQNGVKTRIWFFIAATTILLFSWQILQLSSKLSCQSRLLCCQSVRLHLIFITNPFCCHTVSFKIATDLKNGTWLLPFSQCVHSCLFINFAIIASFCKPQYWL